MFTADAIVGRIALDESPAVASMKRTEQAAAQMARGIRQQSETANQAMGSSFRAGLADIKSQLGKGSLLGQMTKVAMGGGALAGATMLGRELNSLTGEMEGVVRSMRAGELSVGAFTERVMGAIPVLGPFWQAGRNIREMLTGEVAAAEAASRAWASHVQRMQEATTAVKKYATEIRQIRAETRALEIAVSTKDPERSYLESVQGLRDKHAGAAAIIDQITGNQKLLPAQAIAQLEQQMQAMRDQQRALAEQKAKLPKLGDRIDTGPGSNVFGVRDDAAKALVGDVGGQARALDEKIAGLRTQQMLYQESIDLLKEMNVLEDDFTRKEHDLRGEAAAQLVNDAADAWAEAETNRLKGVEELRSVAKSGTDSVSQSISVFRGATQAEDIFGRRTSSSSDRPQVEMLNNEARRGANAMEKAAALLQQLVTLGSRTESPALVIGDI